jgi:hypothetical protein
MIPIRLLFIFLTLVLSSGCTTKKIIPVETGLELKHVCIENGKETCFDGEMMGVIRDGFKRHGITTQIYNGDLQPECEFHLSYMCNRTWDMAQYMHHAELRLYNVQSEIGYAEYHLIGEGGLSLMKWEGTKTKMDPVIDELLISYPINSENLSIHSTPKELKKTTQNNHSETSEESSSENASIHKKLEDLKTIYEKKLITKEEYDKKKQELLDEL